MCSALRDLSCRVETGLITKYVNHLEEIKRDLHPGAADVLLYCPRPALAFKSQIHQICNATKNLAANCKKRRQSLIRESANSCLNSEYDFNTNEY